LSNKGALSVNGATKLESPGGLMYKKYRCGLLGLFHVLFILRNEFERSRNSPDTCLINDDKAIKARELPVAHNLIGSSAARMFLLWQSMTMIYLIDVTSQ